MESNNTILEVALDRMTQEEVWFTTKDDKMYANVKNLYALDEYGELTEKSIERLEKEVSEYLGDGATFIIEAVDQWLQDGLMEGILGYVDNLYMNFEIKPIEEEITAYQEKGVTDLETEVAEEADEPEKEKKTESKKLTESADKDKLIQAMEVIGYYYDDIDSYEGYVKFNCEAPYDMSAFDSWEDVEEYLNELVIDDPDLSNQVEKILGESKKITKSKKVEVYNYYWKDDIDEVEYSEENDDIFYAVAENIQQTDSDYAEYDVFDIMSDIISLWKIEKRSRLYDYLLKWYGSEEELLKNVRDVYDTNNAIYFVTGCGYSIFSADLLGGSANGQAERDFDAFVNNGGKKEEVKEVPIHNETSTEDVINMFREMVKDNPNNVKAKEFLKKYDKEYKEESKKITEAEDEKDTYERRAITEFNINDNWRAVIYKYDDSDFAKRNGDCVAIYDLDVKRDLFPRGQFVAGYFISTLLENRDKSGRVGLDMQGDVPKWKLTPEEYNTLLDKLESLDCVDLGTDYNSKKVTESLNGTEEMAVEYALASYRKEPRDIEEIVSEAISLYNNGNAEPEYENEEFYEEEANYDTVLAVVKKKLGLNENKKITEGTNTTFEDKLKSIFDNITYEGEYRGYYIDNTPICIGDSAVDVDTGEIVEGIRFYTTDVYLIPEVQGGILDIQAPDFITDKNGTSYGDTLSFYGLFEEIDVKGIFEELKGKVKKVDPSNKDEKGFSKIVESKGDFSAYKTYILDNLSVYEDTLTTDAKVVEDNVYTIAANATQELLADIIDDIENCPEGLYNKMREDYEEDIAKIILANIDEIVELNNKEAEGLSKKFTESYYELDYSDGSAWEEGDSFEVTNGEETITITKRDKWIDNQGNRYMGYLSPRDILHYYKGYHIVTEGKKLQEMNFDNDPETFAQVVMEKLKQEGFKVKADLHDGFVQLSVGATVLGKSPDTISVVIYYDENKVCIEDTHQTFPLVTNYRNWKYDGEQMYISLAEAQPMDIVNIINNTINQEDKTYKFVEAKDNFQVHSFRELLQYAIDTGWWYGSEDYRVETMLDYVPKNFASYYDDWKIADATDTDLSELVDAMTDEKVAEYVKEYLSVEDDDYKPTQNGIVDAVFAYEWVNGKPVTDLKLEEGLMTDIPDNLKNSNKPEPWTDEMWRGYHDKCLSNYKELLANDIEEGRDSYFLIDKAKSFGIDTSNGITDGVLEEIAIAYANEKEKRYNSVNFNKALEGKSKKTLTEGARQRLDERNEQSANIIEQALQKISGEEGDRESGIVTKTSEMFQQLSDRGYDVEVSFDNGESTSKISIGQQGASILITITDPEQPLRAFASGNFEITDDNIKMIKSIMEVLK